MIQEHNSVIMQPVIVDDTFARNDLKLSYIEHSPNLEFVPDVQAEQSFQFNNSNVPSPLQAQVSV